MTILQNTPKNPTPTPTADAIRAALLKNIQQKADACTALGKNTKCSVSTETTSFDDLRKKLSDGVAIPEKYFNALVELPLFNATTVDRQSVYFKFINKLKAEANDEIASSEIFKAGQYALLNASKRLLKDKTFTKARTVKGEHYEGGKLRFKYRVQMCQAFRLDAEKSVFVAVDGETGRASYGNLIHCSSGWICPICNAKIMSKRRDEINLAERQNKEVGGRVLMLTLTHSHKKADKLADLLDKQAYALKILWENTALKKDMKEYGYIGQIRGVEMTWGEANGWHPHYHILLHFTDAKVADAVETLHEKIFDVWQKACERAGLGLPNLENGIDLKTVGADDETNGDYICGDAVSWEITSSLTKKAGNERYNQWQILALASNDAEFAGLWREYAAATFGKRMIYFSTKLKQYYKLNVASDSDAVNVADNSSKTIVRHFTDIEWQAIRHFGLQAKILILARISHQKQINLLDEEIEKIVYRYEKTVMADRYGQVLVGYSPDGRALMQ